MGEQIFQFEVNPVGAELSIFQMGNAFINVQDIGDFVAGDPTLSGALPNYS